MSDSKTKYDELVEAGKIIPGDTKLNATDNGGHLILSKKEQNIIKLIQFGRTVTKHELDFEIANTAITLIQENPLLTEIQAIEMAMGEWDIL